MRGCATDIDNIHSLSGLVWAFNKLKCTPQTWYRKLILRGHIVSIIGFLSLTVYR